MISTKHPNTYTLSKALSEDIIYSYHKKLPIVIIRPSQVWYSIEEPFPGFVEGMHSDIGVICGVMTGCVRTMYAGDDADAKVTPVDYIINAAIASCWKRSTTPENEILIYNCTDSAENPLPWPETFVNAKPHMLTYAPLQNQLWYPNIHFTSSMLWHKISLFLFQILPAILFDTFQILSGRKPK